MEYLSIAFAALFVGILGLVALPHKRQSQALAPVTKSRARIAFVPRSLPDRMITIGDTVAYPVRGHYGRKAKVVAIRVKGRRAMARLRVGLTTFSKPYDALARI